MTQKVVPLKWESEQSSAGLTAYAGLPLFMGLMSALELPELTSERVGLRPSQGWSDVQQLSALVLLKLAGGSCLDDLEMLEADPGLCAAVARMESYRLHEVHRDAIAARIRRGGERTFPSPTSARGWLEDVEPDDKSIKAEGDKGAAILEPGAALEGLRELAAVPVRYGKLWPREQTTATLDVDATVAPTSNRSAKHCYKGDKAYQPLSVYWFERRQIVHSEFRDGQCPAGWRIQEVVEDGLAQLPDTVERVQLRSDTAGYQIEFLRAMADGELADAGTIDFAVGVPMSPAFKQSCLEVDADAWEPLELEGGGQLEYARVPFVPNSLGHTRRDLGIRFIAVREPLAQKTLPGLGDEPAQADLPFPTMNFKAGRYKISGVVTNREMADEALLRWHYARCGHSEAAHGECKTDLGGMPFPSSDNFHANAAWWQLTVLAFNLQILLQRDFLRLGTGPLARMKRLRFEFICLAGRVVKHARQWTIRVPADHPGLEAIRTMKDLIETMHGRDPPEPWMKSAA